LNERNNISYKYNSVTVLKAAERLCEIKSTLSKAITYLQFAGYA